MSVNHGGGHILVAEKFLDGADIIAAFEQMRSETVPESVAAGGLGNAAGADRVFHGVLQILFMNVVAAGFGAARIDGGLVGRKDILPGPFAGSLRIFALKRPAGKRRPRPGRGPADEVLSHALDGLAPAGRADQEEWSPVRANLCPHGQ
jgi:hypothetical protein